MKTGDLNDLDCFVSVAEARSFRKAATSRAASPSALSEAVRRLEASLGLRLLNRTTRSVTPTPAGQRLLERLSPALRSVNEAIADIDSNRADLVGTLRLNVPTVVAELVLPPLLARFLARHPAIHVEVVAENSFVDVLAAGFDAGIRYDERVERDMIAIPIGPRQQRMVTAAAPSYLKRHGIPKHPDELLQHALIRFRFSSGFLPPWEFSKNGRTRKISGKGPIISNQIAIQIAAAEAGLGVAHTFEGFLAAALKARRLLPILEDWSDRFPGPYLYYANRRHMPHALRSFVDFIKAEGTSS